MLEFEVKSRVMNVGNRKGQTLYYAQLKTQQKMTTEMVIERIVRETALSEGDARSALISFSNVVREALELGMSVDLAELGNIRTVVPSKMMDMPEQVTVKDALKAPKIVFTPKQKMRDAANAVVRSIDRGSTKSTDGGASEPGGGTGGDGDQSESPMG